MSAQIILGIDPGAHGAIAVLDEGGDLLDVVDMPSTPEGNGRSATNATLLAGLLAQTHAPIAFCESVSARFGVRRWPRSWRHRGLCRRAFLSAGEGMVGRAPDTQRKWQRKWQKQSRKWQSRSYNGGSCGPRDATSSLELVNELRHEAQQCHAAANDPQASSPDGRAILQGAQKMQAKFRRRPRQSRQSPTFKRQCAT
jgi:hypothetical protein